MKSLVEHFSVIADPRQLSKIDHELVDVLILCVVGVLCGAEGWHDIEMVGHARYKWFEERGLLKKGVPVDDTIARIVSRIHPEALQSCFIGWMKVMEIETDKKIIAVDGKTLKHSFDKKKSKLAIHMVSAFAVENGVVLGQTKTAEKSNEITAIPELLKMLDIKGGIVTIDAMGCQKKIAEKIIHQEADYVLTVKDNQKKLHDDIKNFFQAAKENNFYGVNYDYHEEMNKEHGRTETRKYWISDCIDTIKNFTDWKGLNTIGMVEAQRCIHGKTSSETRYFIASIKNNASLFGHAVRSHWAVENSLHWVLDVSFREDNSRIRRDHSSENMSVFRHLVINAIRNEKTTKKSVKGKRFKATLEPEYAEKILSNIF